MSILCSFQHSNTNLHPSKPFVCYYSSNMTVNETTDSKPSALPRQSRFKKQTKKENLPYNATGHTVPELFNIDCGTVKNCPVVRLEFIRI